jgi:hypothetical protein
MCFCRDFGFDNGEKVKMQRHMVRFAGEMRLRRATFGAGCLGKVELMVAVELHQEEGY